MRQIYKFDLTEEEIKDVLKWFDAKELQTISRYNLMIGELLKNKGEEE